jgi:CRISPR-associated endonuclease/helicase Cas3
MTRLLAKSPYPGRPDKTLQAHTCDVMDAFGFLFGSAAHPARLALAWQRFFGLADLRPFWDCGLAACAFHDWGKANQGFLDALTNAGQQVIRHEHLSGLLLALGATRAWLADRPELDQDVILAAVIGHHLKVKHDNFAQKLSDQAVLRVLSDCDDFRALLQFISHRLGLNSDREPHFPPVWAFGGEGPFFDLRPHRKRVQDRLWQFDRTLRRDAHRRRLLWAVRAALIAADAVGSAVVRLAGGLEQWVGEAFDPRQVLTEPDVWCDVITPRVEELKAKGRWDESRGARGWSRFQEDCADLGERALLLAPCGSGKTLAAWRWIAAQLARRPAARIIFLYPTRATATEGFRDYVSWAPETRGALVHGTAEYDLQGMFENPADPSFRDPRQGKVFDMERRLFALALWARRTSAATVDQFFAFLQYQYGPVCLLPLLSDAVIVVDEVHSFDRGMFSSLKQFLQTFDVPVLCMTATLPARRQQDLTEGCKLQLYPREMPDDLRQAAEWPRYSVHRIDAADAVPRVRAALERGQRVLWVVNQVRRAQRAAARLADALPADVLHVTTGVPLYCYHSRFKLNDRRIRHRQVVDAFQQNRQPVVAVTTQVCEMSLDLDADLLITEDAPVTALIQRMGRCNRQRIPPPGRIGEVCIYAPEDGRPYDAVQLEGVRGFVEALTRQEQVSQRDLECALERYGPAVVEPDKACQFLQSGPYAIAGEEDFRDIEEFTTPAVLDGDVGEFLALQKKRLPTDGLVVPVPRRFARQRHADLPAYLGVAPRALYLPAVGFCDQPLP